MIMQKKIKILIYCRIGEQLSRNLLDYLVDQLKVSVIQNHMDIIGVIKKISTEKWLNSFEMRRLIISLVKKEITVIFVNYSSRISMFPATYDEFEMYCHVHDVLVSLFMI
jgi:hypothetical protein